MGIGTEDLYKLLNLKKNYHNLKKCAILGDCSFWYSHGSKEHFKNIMNLDIVETFDISGEPDFKLDLTLELDKNFKNKYDLVIDAGTLACVFDIPTCLKNILFMLKDNGIIVHEDNLIGHFGKTRAIYGLSPHFFNLFYKNNGCEIIEMSYLIKGGEYKYINIPKDCTYLSNATQSTLNWVNSPATTLNMIPCDCSIFVIVRRINDIKFNKNIY